jgi:hypothetical protein
MRTWLSLIALPLVAISVVSGLPAMAGDRAGLIPWKKGDAGVTVKVFPPMSNANYSVSVQQANTAGYSPISECTYFNVLKLEPDNFQIQHKKCKDGQPVPVDDTISMLWIIVTWPE